MREQSLADQIERSLFELEFNSPDLIQKDPRHTVRRFRWDSEAFQSALAALRERLDSSKAEVAAAVQKPDFQQPGA